MAKISEFGRLKAVGLNYIQPSLIERNDQNPRIIFDPEKIKELRDSIKDVGILVPLIAYFDDKKRKYILLDGERRLKCAKELTLKDVPVNIIAKPTKLQNILEMFNIHDLRIEWNIIETAWKIQDIINVIGTDNETEIAKLIPLKKSEIKRCKTLLSFTKKYQKMVFQYFESRGKNGLKPDFLIEMNNSLNAISDLFPEIIEKNTRNGIIDSLIYKYKNGIIKRVTDFRTLTKIIKSAKKSSDKQNIFSLIEKLIKDSKYSIQEAYEATIKHSSDIKLVKKESQFLMDILKNLRIQETNKIENNELTNILTDLKKIIEKKLKELGV